MFKDPFVPVNACIASATTDLLSMYSEARSFSFSLGTKSYEETRAVHVMAVYDYFIGDKVMLGCQGFCHHLFKSLNLEFEEH